MSLISAFLAVTTGLSVLAPTPPTPSPPAAQQSWPYPAAPVPFPLPPGLEKTTSAAPRTPEPGAPAWCPALPGRRAECGTVSRPLVAGKPELGTIDVAYALVRRENEAAPAKNTVMVNPGGPGGAPIAIAAWYAALTAPLRADHDLLLIDPRGTGQSGTLSCGIGDLILNGRAELRRMAAQCGANLGPRAEGYTSAATADDFNAVRQRLGLGKVVLYGVSYGTYLMPIYAERHPDSVRSIVVSAAFPVTFDSLGGPSARQISLTLRRICARSGACDGAATVRDLRKVNARLRVRPVELTITVGGRPHTMTLDESLFAMVLTFAASGGVGGSPDVVPLIGRMPAHLHKAARGDVRPLAAELTAAFQEYADTAAGGDNSLTLTVVCNDYTRAWSVDAPLRTRRRQFDRAVRAADPAGFGAFSRESFASSAPDGGDACIEWPKEGTARPYKLTGKLPDVPTLVLAGDLDNNTPEENSRLNAAQFPRATFLVVPNTGHAPEMDATGCAISVVTGFIRDERLGDTSCLAHIPPPKVSKPY
ncbi:alpha/beta fold hydrolase [Nonomuraea typhae]|uniref:alpha/beta fold hydrolase n=1 Tax=Nonomuraea typhae TaxID=2603600 RepID=UPI0012F95BC4|nr:alpha/beta fold hydrolase [Nonomuraea typhae]